MVAEKSAKQLQIDIEAILEQYAGEYQALAEHSENQSMGEEALKRAYEELNAKTGLAELFEALAI